MRISCVTLSGQLAELAYVSSILHVETYTVWDLGHSGNNVFHIFSPPAVSSSHHVRPGCKILSGYIAWRHDELKADDHKRADGKLAMQPT